MAPSGPPTPIGGAQLVPALLLRSNCSLMGGNQTNSIQSQPPFSSLVLPGTQFNSNSLLANISNVSSLLNHSFQNGGPVSVNGGLSVPLMNPQQRSALGGSMDMLGNAETDPMSFTSSSGAAQGHHFQNPNGNQLGADHQQNQQLDSVQNFQQQFQVPQSQHQQQHQQRGGMGNVGNLGQVKLEQQTGPTDQNGPMQQLQALRGMDQVILEPQKLQSLRSLGPVKMEPQHADASMFPQQQQQQQQQQHHHHHHQQQQFMQLLRQSSQAAAAAQMNLLHQQQQQILHQQQQQQLILKSLPQQRAQLQQQQLHQQNLPVRPPQVKPAVYEP